MIGKAVTVLSWLQRRVRGWTWVEWSVASGLTLLSALSYAKLAWTEGIGLSTSCNGDSCMIEGNPILWFPSIVLMFGPIGELWIILLYGYWLTLGVITSWFAITALKFARRRLRRATPVAVQEKAG